MGVANKFFTSRTSVPVSQFIGEKGRLFYDEATGALYLSDGVTPGGVAVSSGGGGSSYVLPTASNNVLGGVKIGSNITISNGVISVASPFSGSYLDLTNKPTIPAAQVNSDWNAVSGLAQILNKPVFATVATTGSYTDLTNTPNLNIYLTSSSLSVVTNAPGTNSLTYNAGVFTFTPYSYALPTASTTVLGGVKVDGTTITINGGVISSSGTGTVIFKGSWNASTNTPTLSANQAGAQSGWEYIVTVAGTRNLGNGSVTFNVGDLVIYDGTAWNDIPGNAATVTSFNTRTGAVTLSNTDVTTALGYTPIQYSSLSVGTPNAASGSGSISYNNTTGVFTYTPPVLPVIPTYTVSTASASGGGALSLTGTTFTFTPASVPTYTVTTAATPVAGGALSLSGSVFTYTPTTVYTLPTASSTVLGGVKVDNSTITISNGVISANYATSVTLNGTSVTLGSSGTITAAAGTLTGTTLNSTVVNSSLTSVGTLTGLTVTSSTTTGATITAQTSPAHGTTATWTFVGNGNIGGPNAWIQFPDSSIQTTAYTGNAATVTNGVYTTDTGTVTNTMLAGSIANNKLTNSSVTVNGTSIALGASGTVTADASTLTNTTLNSTVVSSSLTSVGTLTGLTVSGTINANGGTIATTQTTANLLNTTATTINFGGAATAITVGKASSQLTINASTIASGLTTGTLGLFDTGFTGTLNFGNAATNVYIGNNSSLIGLGATTIGVTNATAINLGASTGTTTVNHLLKVNYTGAGSSSSINIAGYNSKGGTGYHDFLTVANGYGSATNPNKSFRLGSTGTLEILNSAYTSVILSLSDAGFLTLAQTTGATNNIPVNNSISFNNHTYMNDDGNFHLTTTGGSIWLNSNDGGNVKINQQMPNGITAGGLDVGGAVTGGTSSGSVAFIAGTQAANNISLQMPTNSALRDTTNGASNMYFDVSTGGATNGTFQWRSSSSFTQLAFLNSTQFLTNVPVTLGGSTVTAYLSVIGSKTYSVTNYGYLSTGGAGSISGNSGNVAYGIYCANRIQSGEVDVTSDERVKDIQGTIPLDSALRFVRQVDGILYTWKPGMTDGEDDTGLKAGFGAQAVHKAGFDHMIGHIPNERLEEQVDDDGWVHPKGIQMTMGYNQAIPYHHEVIKHLLDRIEQLEATVAKLTADK